MTRKFSLRAISLSALAALTLTATGAQAEDKTHNFSMATSWPGGPLMDHCLKDFTEKLKTLSNGRINIETFPAGTLGPGLKVSETVKNGVAQMGHLWVGYDWGADPTAVLFGGFAGSFDTEKTLHWLYRAGGGGLAY